MTSTNPLERPNRSLLILKFTVPEIRKRTILERADPKEVGPGPRGRRIDHESQTRAELDLAPCLTRDRARERESEPERKRDREREREKRGA